MKRFLVLLLFPVSAFAQIPHITQPFFYLWDYSTSNLQGVVGFTQVAHFEHQLDLAPPVTLPSTVPSTPSTTTGFTTFKLAADPATPVGSHTFNVIACPTLVVSTAPASGCVASLSPFAFVLDPPLAPLGSAQRLGVGK